MGAITVLVCTLLLRDRAPLLQLIRKSKLTPNSLLMLKRYTYPDSVEGFIEDQALSYDLAPRPSPNPRRSPQYKPDHGNTQKD